MSVENLGGHMQAIVTRYHGPTNTRGARISATTESGISVSIPYPHEASRDDKGFCAVKALCDKMGWSGKIVNGGLAKGAQVWVFLP